jgi:geranyl diphosphate 2-C-methyltransferase
MYTKFNNNHTQTQNSLSTAVFDYYNNKKNDRNLLQAVDGFVHHHFGLGPTEIDAANATTEEITAEVQRQENKLTSHLINFLQFDKISNRDERAIDLGCGRGGTIFRIIEKFPNVRVDGINLTEYQTNFCKEEIEKRNLQDRTEVRQANFLSIPYADSTFSHAYCCEVTQYALDLEVLFKEVYRVLQPGGRFVIATWCFNDNLNTQTFNEFIEPINDHYASTMHGINEYTDAIKDSGLNLIFTEDRTADLVPYWELRSHWELKSGIEEYFIENHKNNKLNYYFIVASKPKL